MAYVLTSVSGNLISAASASFAPTNGADVSAIASAYAESAVSSKLDESATADFYSTSNPSGFITGVDLSNYATTAYVDSSISSFVDSAYVESQVSGKQDTLTFDWDANSAISSINGSALAGGGGSVTGDYVENSALDSVTAYSATGGVSSMTTGISSISGQPLIPTYLANPTYQYGGQSTFVYMPASSIWTTADAATGVFSPLQYATGACLAMDSQYFKGYIKGNELFICNTAIGRAARLEVHQNRGSRLGLTGNNGSAAVNLKESELTIINSTVSTATLGRTKLEFKSPVSGTGTYATNYINLYDMAESATKTISSTSIDYWNGKADSSALSSYVPYSSLEYNTASAISGINGSALAAGSTYSAGEGIDITDDVISVEAPVDIVAGPGIVIDNPDGNTLRVSMAADYDVTLFETTFANAVGGDVTLSENAANFDQLRITYILIGSSQSYAPLSTELVDVSTFSDGFSFFTLNQEYMENGGADTAYFIIRTAAFGIEGNKLKFKNAVGTSDFGSKTALTSSTAKILKVVGIHRIANN